jgi:hypothetical protein
MRLGWVGARLADLTAYDRSRRDLAVGAHSDNGPFTTDLQTFTIMRCKPAVCRRSMAIASVTHLTLRGTDYFASLSTRGYKVNGRPLNSGGGLYVALLFCITAVMLDKKQR